MKSKKPVLLLVFNRPEATQKVLREIIKYNPSKLYVSCDGPRNEEDETLICKINAQLKSIENIQIVSRFLETNIGCRKAVKSGIDWFFENEQNGIILEDDCLPGEDFFEFCSQLLDQYKSEKQVAHISGTNYSYGKLKIKYSYYFSKYFHIWGWATWKDRWERYKEKVDLEEIESIVEKNFKNHSEKNFWRECFYKVYNEEFDTWDFQWVFTNLYYDSKAIMPSKNLVTNIGFHPLATHTTDPSNILAKIPIERIDFPLKHQKSLKYKPYLDYYSKIIFGNYGLMEKLFFYLKLLILL